MGERADELIDDDSLSRAERRRVRRIGLVEQAGLRGDGPAAERTSGTETAELTVRLQFWAGPSAVHPRRVLLRGMGPGGQRVVRGVLYAGLAALVIYSYAGGSGVHVALLLSLVVLKMVHDVQDQRRYGSLRLAVVNRRCPDCGYDLKGAKDGVDPRRVGGLRVGPSCCPECGGAWPLLPPPVPGRFAAPADAGTIDSARAEGLAPVSAAA